MKRLRDFIPFALLVAVTLPFAVVPYRISLRMGDAVGVLVYLFWRSRRRIAMDNLRGAVSRGAITLNESPHSVVFRNFRNLGRFFVEVSKIYYGVSAGIFRNVELIGAENLRKALDKGKGVLLISGHCGNWELMGVYISRHLTKVKGIARKQDNFYINRLIEKTRQRYGNSVIYKEGALKKLLASLKRNEAVGMLIDQSVVRSEGLILQFLGRNAYVMKTPAIIARKTGSPVVPLFIRRTKNGHMIEIGDEIPLTEGEDSDFSLICDTANFSGAIEEFIRKYPAEWLWIHRRWKRPRENAA